MHSKSKTHRLTMRCDQFVRAQNGDRTTKATYVVTALMELSEKAARGVKRKHDCARAIVLLRGGSPDHRNLAKEVLGRHLWLRAEVLRVLNEKRANREKGKPLSFHLEELVRETA